jgi:hypothetical protein
MTDTDNEPIQVEDDASWILTDYTSPYTQTTESGALSVSVSLDNFRCPEGYYCVAGTSVLDSSNECPAGTWNPQTGAKSIDQCIHAPPGFYIDNTAATELYNSGETASDYLCDEGYYCAIGSTTA